MELFLYLLQQFIFYYFILGIIIVFILFLINAYINNLDNYSHSDILGIFFFYPIVLYYAFKKKNNE